jgi:hypothetical protein
MLIHRPAARDVLLSLFYKRCQTIPVVSNTLGGDVVSDNEVKDTSLVFDRQIVERIRPTTKVNRIGSVRVGRRSVGAHMRHIIKHETVDETESAKTGETKKDDNRRIPRDCRTKNRRL